MESENSVDFVILAEDERVIKEYDAMRMISPCKLDIGIALTTKRVIFHGKGMSWFGLGENRLVDDVNINKVVGTEIFKGRSVNIIQLIIGALIALYGISTFGTSIFNENKYAYGNREDFIATGIIASIIGILIIIFSFKLMFYITMRAENTNPITIGKEKASIVKPLVGADIVIKEIGAMILNIQLHGDKLLEQLRCPNPGCKYVRAFDEKPKHCPECGTEWTK